MANFLSRGLDYVTDTLGLSNTDQVNKANEQLSTILGEAQKTSEQNRGLYNQYLQKMQDTFGAGAEKYDTAMGNYEAAIGQAPEQFTPTGSVEDYYDKFANQRAQAAQNAIANSRANAGGMFSSDYLNQLAAKQQALASEEWSKAFDKYNQSLNQQMNIFNTNAQQRQNYLSNLGNLAQTYGQDRTNLASSYDNYLSNLANQNTADLSNYAQVMGQISSNEANKQRGLGTLAGIAGAFLG